METISLEPKQFSLNVDIEVAPPLLQTMYKEPTMIIQSYGINAQEGGQMSQVLAEHAQTLGDHAQGWGCREVWSGQCGATIRNGNNWWRDVCFTLSTATGDNVPCVMEIYE